MLFWGERDALSVKRIERKLRSCGLRVSSFESIDSTNDEARRQATAGESVPALIIAASQSAGRGRMGRSFYSPADTGLYMSLLLDAGEDMASALKLTTAASVAVAEGIEAVFGVKTGIKWVNDVYIDGKKVSGILCESFVSPSGKRYAVIGIGVNISTKNFPEELCGIAASITDKESDRYVLALEISSRLLEFIGELSAPRIMETYRARSIVLGERVVFIEKGHSETATVKAIEDSGALRVILSDGSERLLCSGEISLRRCEK